MFAGRRPADLGVNAGKLAPCRSTPNCVNSQAADEAHRIAPLAFPGPAKAAMARLKAVISAMERVTIITEGDDYLYAEFKSRLMGYVDDVEFALDAKAQVIHVRSASRLGSSDFGVNRKRIEAIRARFQE